MVLVLAMMVAAVRGTSVPECAAYARSAKWQAAEECYTAALRRHGDASTLQAAIRVYQKSLTHHGPKPDRVYNLALALFRSGQVEECLSLLTKFPDENAERYALAGAAWRATGDLEKALPALQQAAVLQPRNESYRCDYVLTLLRAGLEAEATAELEQAASLFPRSARVQGAFGLLAFGRGDYAGAVARYRQAVEFEPEAAEMHASLGDVYAATGDLAQAEAAYGTAIRLAPGDSSYRVKRGRSLQRLQRQQEAVVEWKKALSANPNDLEAHFELGKTAAASGDGKSALLHLEKVARSPEAPPEALYQLSLVYKRLGRPEDSARTLKRFQQRRRETQELEKGKG